MIADRDSRSNLYWLAIVPKQRLIKLFKLRKKGNELWLSDRRLNSAVAHEPLRVGDVFKLMMTQCHSKVRASGGDPVSFEIRSDDRQGIALPPTFLIAHVSDLAYVSNAVLLSNNYREMQDLFVITFTPQLSACGLTYQRQRWCQHSPLVSSARPPCLMGSRLDVHRKCPGHRRNQKQDQSFPLRILFFPWAIDFGCGLNYGCGAGSVRAADQKRVFDNDRIRHMRHWDCIPTVLGHAASYVIQAGWRPPKNAEKPRLRKTCCLALNPYNNYGLVILAAM